MPKKHTKIDDIHIHIGSKIKQYRYEQGLSRNSLAPKVGISHQQLKKYEDGENKISVGRLIILANTLNKNIMDFIDVDKSGIDTQILSRIDLEIMRNISKLKNVEFKENLNILLKTLVKSYVN